MITLRIMIATFHGNPETTVISCYSPTNVSDEIDTEIFYSDLSSLIRQVPKHNVLLIGGDFNAQLGQNNFKQAYHINSNRNGEMLKNLLLENKLVCLNTLFQKRQGQKLTHTAQNIYTSQIDYVIINKKWKNSAKNCRAYNSFASIASDHRIVSAQIKLSLRENKKKTSKNKPYEWSCLKKNTEIRKSFITNVKNRFEILLNTSSTKTADSTFAHFETSCKEISKEIIPLKPKLKKRLPWETLEISNKRTILQETAEKCNSHPIMENIRQFKKAQTNLVLSYDKEQSEYIQSKIDEIQNAVRNQKSAKAWKIVNEVSGRKNYLVNTQISMRMKKKFRKL